MVIIKLCTVARLIDIDNLHNIILSKMVRQAGIEPATHGLKVRYLTAWLLAHIRRVPLGKDLPRCGL